MIIQRCCTTCLVNEPQNAYSIGVGVCIATTNVCIFCRRAFVANLMTTKSPILAYKPEYVRLNQESTFRVF